MICLEIGIMKLGQFVCLGNLQRLKNRFGKGYAAQIKLATNDLEKFKSELTANINGVEILGENQFDWQLNLISSIYLFFLEEHNGMLYCNVPYAAPTDASDRPRSARLMNLAHVFDWFSKKNEEGVFESYSITQTTLEQIFVRVAGEEQDPEPVQTTAL